MTTRSASPGSQDLVLGLVAASATYDPAGVRRQLDQGVETLGLGGCLDEVVFPAMRHVGRNWRSGRLDIGAERLATETVRAWFEILTLRAPACSEAAPVILACGPADQHSLGLEALALLLSEQGTRCRVLGPRTSVRTLGTAVRANRPSTVVVVSHLRVNRPRATESLRAVAALGVDAFYAGEAFATARLRRNVPGTHLDSDLRDACAVILGTVNGANPG